MPQAVAWVAAQLAIIVTDLLLVVGVPLGAAVAIGQATFLAAQALIYAGAAYASAPQIPHPESGKRSVRFAVSRRRRGYGTSVRIAGTYALYEATKGKAYCVIALHHGRIQSINAYYLHDDLVTLDGSGYVDILAADRYGTDKVQIKTRLGADTETAYSEVVADLPTLWTNDHRGDHVASLMMIARSVEDTRQAKVYPNGLPEPSVVAALSPVWDWRVTGQDPDNDSTWSASNNPFLNLRDFICGSPDDGCMGEDFDRRILPSIDYWTAAADDCDSSIAKIGGTETRYELAGFYDFDNHPADIIGEMLKCCDGWMAEAGDGSLIVRSGKYYTPTFSIAGRMVTDYTFRRFQPDEEVTNELLITYCDAAQHHTMVETDPWRDEADITARGVERTDNFELRWVQRHTQARRLAKRRMAREQAPTRGTVTTNLAGLRGLGERYANLDIPEIAALNDIVIEILKVKVDLANRRLTFTWIQADPDIDDWDPATEEGNAPDTDRPDLEDDDVPVITDAAVFFQLNGTTYSARIQLFLEEPDRDDVRYSVRWRVSGGTQWTTEAAQEASTSGAFEADFEGDYYQLNGTEYGDAASIPGWTFTRTTVGYAQTVAGTLTAFAVSDPRITDKGLLIEPAATNLIEYSQELDNGTYWGQSRITISANADAAPDGTTTADRIIEDTTASNTHAVQNTTSFTSGETYTFSVYLKPGTRTWAQLRLPSAAFGTTGSAYFNLATGAVGTIGGSASAGSEVLANGWVRCWITKTASATASGNAIILLATGDGGATYTGDGASYISAWGAQVEVGSGPSSYIVTAAGSATRNADELEIVLLPGAPSDDAVIEHDGGTITSDRATLAPGDIIDLGASTAGAWVGGYVQRVAIDGTLYVITGFVPSDRDIECEVAFVFPNGSLSDWSATETVNTSTSGTGGNPLPGDPGVGGGGGPGHVP